MSKTGITKTGITKTGITKTSMSKTGITETSMSKTGITKTSIRMSQIGSVVDCWGVVDQGSGSRDDSGMSTEDGGISLTPLSLSWGSSGSNKGKVGSYGFSNLWGNLDWLGGNAGIDWSNGQTRVSNAESSCISDILNLLKLTIGINIRVSTGDSAISVSDNMSVGVDVSVTIVQVSELILSVEPASSRVWSISSIGRGGSSISNWGSGNWSWGSGISICWGSSSSVEKTSIASIGKVTVRITTISQRRGYDLSLISKADGQQSRQCNKNFHDVTRCVMLNGVPC